MFAHDEEVGFAIAVAVLLGLLGWLVCYHPWAAVGVAIVYPTSIIATRWLVGPLVIVVPTRSEVGRLTDRCCNAMARVHSLRADSLRTTSELERWRLALQDPRVQNDSTLKGQIEALLGRMSVAELSQDLTLADAEAALRQATSELEHARRQIWLASLHPVARSAVRLP